MLKLLILILALIMLLIVLTRGDFCLSLNSKCENRKYKYKCGRKNLCSTDPTYCRLPTYIFKRSSSSSFLLRQTKIKTCKQDFIIPTNEKIPKKVASPKDLYILRFK